MLTPMCATISTISPSLNPTVRSDATYLDPHVFQEGMTWVLVNGRFVVDGGEVTDALPGTVLERQRDGRVERPVG